jgi:hypothetical protein
MGLEYHFPTSHYLEEISWYGRVDMVDMVESILAIMRGSILGRKVSSRLQYFDTRFRQMQI